MPYRISHFELAFQQPRFPDALVFLILAIFIFYILTRFYAGKKKGITLNLVPRRSSLTGFNRLKISITPGNQTKNHSSQTNTYLSSSRVHIHLLFLSLVVISLLMLIFLDIRSI